jgi:hypothetical protein
VKSATASEGHFVVLSRDYTNRVSGLVLRLLHGAGMGGFACPILGGPVLELENLDFITKYFT